VKLSERSWDSPRIGVIIFIVQGFDLLLFLLFTESGWVGKSEELRWKFHEPFLVPGQWPPSCILLWWAPVHDTRPWNIGDNSYTSKLKFIFTDYFSETWDINYMVCITDVHSLDIGISSWHRHTRFCVCFIYILHFK